MSRPLTLIAREGSRLPHPNGRYDTDGSAAIDNSELKAAHKPSAFTPDLGSHFWGLSFLHKQMLSEPPEDSCSPVEGYGWCAGKLRSPALLLESCPLFTIQSITTSRLWSPRHMHSEQQHLSALEF